MPTRREREGCAAAVFMLAQNRLRAEEIADLVELLAFAAPRMVDVLERIGREKGKAEGEAEHVLLVLRRRCGEPAEAVARRISTERDLAVLDRWLNVALRCASLEHFTIEAFEAKG